MIKLRRQLWQRTSAIASTSQGARRSRLARGFTLVEILVVVIILGILAAIVLPRISGATTESRINTFCNNLKTYGLQLSLYHDRFGEWPDDRSPGVFPIELSQQLRAEPWTSPSPIGGEWDWDKDVFDVEAGVSIYQPAESEETIQKIDAVIDDGNLDTGHFRRRTDGYILVLSE
jgi:prepilin-type N-terminal cleavage/methylation domain-containing protein